MRFLQKNMMQEKKFKIRPKNVGIDRFKIDLCNGHFVWKGHFKSGIERSFCLERSFWEGQFSSIERSFWSWMTVILALRTAILIYVTTILSETVNLTI